MGILLKKEPTPGQLELLLVA